MSFTLISQIPEKEYRQKTLQKYFNLDSVPKREAGDEV
jgi:hypothetical protein